MKEHRLSYELSEAADNDLEHIFDFTVEKFGFDQAVNYLNNFDSLFVYLTTNPETGRKRDDVKFGLRSVAQESHTVFYTILKDRIRIVRILHGSRDIIRFL